MKITALSTISLLALTSCARLSRPDLRPELAGVYRSARSIEGALAAGVTYPDFSMLVREFSTELLLARDNARYNPPSKLIASALDRYADLLSMYKDTEQIWGWEVQDQGAGLHELPVLAVKYGVPEAFELNSSGTRIEKGSPEKLRQAIWQQALKLHEGQIIPIVHGFAPQK
jgi:hypothetical protein